MAVFSAFAPTITDDVNRGYSVSQLWVVTGITPAPVYQCRGNLAGSAVWDLLSFAVARDAGERRTIRFDAASGAVALSGLNTNLNDVTPAGGGFDYEADGLWRRMSSGASVSQANIKYTNGSNGLALVDNAPLWWWYIKTGADITDAAYTGGVSERTSSGPPASGSGVNTDSHAYIAYDTDRGDTGWVLDTADGVTQEVSAQIAPIAADTAYLFFIDQTVPGQVSVSVRTGTTWSNTVANAVNVPAGADAMRPWATVSALAAAGRTLKAGYLAMSSE